MLFLLSRAVGFRLLLCLVLLIRFRRFVAHDKKGSSCDPQSQRGLGRPRVLLGADRSLICSLSGFSLAKEDQVNDNAYQDYGHDNQMRLTRSALAQGRLRRSRSRTVTKQDRSTLRVVDGSPAAGLLALPWLQLSQGYNRQFERRTATLLQFAQLMHRNLLRLDWRLRRVRSGL